MTLTEEVFKNQLREWPSRKEKFPQISTDLFNGPMKEDDLQGMLLQDKAEVAALAKEWRERDE